MKMRQLATLFAFTLSVAVGVFWWQSTRVQPSAPVIMDNDPTCTLNTGACDATLPHSVGKLTLELAPRPIPVMQDISAHVHVVGMDAVKTITLRIEGEDMFMGIQSTVLTKTSDSEFTGKIMLPVCTTDSMRWRAKVDVLIETDTVQAIFPFVTYRPK